VVDALAGNLRMRPQGIVVSALGSASGVICGLLLIVDTRALSANGFRKGSFLISDILFIIRALSPAQPTCKGLPENLGATPESGKDKAPEGPLASTNSALAHELTRVIT
jgi:hypothetical protein